MAFFFMKLPAETRNQIYRYLLRDDDAYVYLVNHPTNKLESAQQNNLVTTRSPEQDIAIDTKETLICLSDEDIPFRLSPEILGTSRQIYNEAVNILYGENVFCYALSKTHFDVDIDFCRTPDVSRRALQRVSWLRMYVEKEDDDEEGKFGTKLLDGFGLFSSPECSLQGFWLDMLFLSHQGTSRDNQPPLSQFVLQDTRFMSALMALEDLKKLQIYICDGTTGCAGPWADWIQSIATKKNWRCTTESTCDEHKKSVFRRTWDLFPVGEESCNWGEYADD